MKSRLDDIASRYNHIEALNKELSDKIEALEGERSSFKDRILEEQQTVLDEMQTQLLKTEADLARIRGARDDLLQDQALRRAREESKFSAAKEVSELSEARAARIASLEFEVERLRRELDSETQPSDANTADLDLPQLRQKHEQLDKAYKVLAQELPGLEQAFKKAHELSSKKVAYLQETEDKLKRLLLEVRPHTSPILLPCFTNLDDLEKQSRFEVLCCHEIQRRCTAGESRIKEPELKEHRDYYPTQRG